MIKRKNKPASTPMTMPAIAPAERPLLETALTPGRAVPEAEAPPAEGVMKGTVAVADPVEVTVVAALTVGRRGSEAGGVGVGAETWMLLLTCSSKLLLEAAHWPA